MKYVSNKILFRGSRCRRAFTLTETLAALGILALMSSSILVVMNRCMASSANLTNRMRAFEVARENMEQLLALSTIEETTEFGISEQYPDIEWEITVEMSNDSATSLMWAKAISTATYIDTEGEEQKIELTHWLTDLNSEQQKQIEENKKLERELFGKEGSKEKESPQPRESDEPETPSDKPATPSDGAVPPEFEGWTFDQIWEYLMRNQTR